MRPFLQERVSWHRSQEVLVGRWPAGFPVAVLPLWQVAQPVETLGWRKSTFDQLAALWHVAQSACTGMCEADLPCAIAPLWQVMHGSVTPRCSNLAACQLAVV